MLLTISTTHRPATDLGHLLHKNPERLHEKPLAFGRALMAYPEAGTDRCTFALFVEVDPVALVRGKGHGRGKTGGLLDHYVNDRPYAASSLLSVAISRTISTALNGRSKDRQQLAETPIPLEARVTPVPARGQEDLAARLFEPLGYTVTATPHPLVADDDQWGDSPYITLDLAGTARLADLLSHLYVLVPVLDNRKHYYVDDGEVEKLLAKGAGWLENHPEKDFIATRYLKRRGRLVREALARLADSADADAELDEEARGAAEEVLEKPLRLHDLRLQAVTQVLKDSGARRVVDLGCGEGKLMRYLLAEKQFSGIIGVDASLASLERAEQKLRLDTASDRVLKRIQLMHGALTYRDRRLEGCDAAALVEVIEHLDPDRLPALERVMFEFIAPATVVVTTPNRDYNVLFEDRPSSGASGRLRHPDHRFEWTRAEFAAWAEPVAEKFGYTVTLQPLGDEDPVHGAPSQMAVFERGRPS